MKKIYPALAFFIGGVLLLLNGLWANYSNMYEGHLSMKLGLLCMLIGLVLLFIFIGRKSGNEPEETVIIGDKRSVLSFNIAGATYLNDDSSSRQAVLKKLYKEQGKRPKPNCAVCPVNDGIPEEDEDYRLIDYGITIQGYEYDGKQAFRVLYDNRCIGNVPVDCVEKVAAIFDDITSVTLDVDQCKDEDGRIIYLARMNLSYRENETE